MYLETKDKSQCCGCNACVKVCPIGCISLETDSEGFVYPVKDEKKCINCNKCVRICPVESKFEGEVRKAYAGTSPKDESVINSSSGGVYPLIAEQFVKNNGVVYAVELNEKLETEYIRVETLSDIPRTQGSKYVQTILFTEMYNNIDLDLKAGKRVLFVGTPCQVNAVKNVFNHENLFTVDFICHGVPSKLMLRKYIDSLENKHKGRVVGLNFRNKEKYGWSITLSYDIQRKQSVKRYYLPHKLSAYFLGFLHGLILRESCYKCAFSNAQRVSDMTLSDFWGCKKWYPELVDSRGVSLVLINSDKGDEIIKNLLSEESVLLKEIDVNVGLSNSVNKNLSEATARKKGRDTIYNDLETKGFEYIDKKYFYPLVTAKERIIAHIPYSFRKFVKKILKK